MLVMTLSILSARRASRESQSLLKSSCDACSSNYSASSSPRRTTQALSFSSGWDSSGSSPHPSRAHRRVPAGVPANATRSNTGELVAVDVRVFSYERRLVAHAKEHSWSQALREFNDMQARGMIPSDHCCSAILAALNRSGRWWHALHVFEVLVGSSGGKHTYGGPGVSCYNAAIGACSRGSRWESAIALLSALQEGRSATARGPDAVSYSTAVDACAKKAKWETAIALLLKATAVALEPTVTALGAALAAQEKASQWTRALSLLDWGRGQNISLSVVAYNSCISACGSGGRWDHSLALVARMRLDMLVPSIISYNAAIRACATESQHQLAIGLHSDAIDHKLKPTSITYTGIINAHGNSGAWQDAVAQLQIAEAARDRVCWTSAISACAQNRQWVAALALFRDLPSRGAHPDATAFNATIAAFMDADNWEWSLELLGDMRATVVEPDHATFTTVVAIASRASATATALACYREAVDLDIMGDGQDHRIGAPVIDFHYHSIDVARVALGRTVLDRTTWPRRRGAHGKEPPEDLVFVVGRGTGSPDGKSLLSPAVLTALCHEFSPPLVGSTMSTNVGRLIVSASSVQRWAEGEL